MRRRPVASSADDLMNVNCCLFCERHDAAANYDEASAQQDHRRGLLTESEPGNQLRHGEEKSHIYSDNPPEVPRWGVDNVSVESKDQASEHEKQGRSSVGGAAQSHAHQGIATRLQKSCTQ